MEALIIALSINKQKVSCIPINFTKDNSNAFHMKCAVQVMRELTTRTRTQLRVGGNFVHINGASAGSEESRTLGHGAKKEGKRREAHCWNCLVDRVSQLTKLKIFKVSFV